jgi:hypothetical protein
VWSAVFRRASPLTFPGTPNTPIYDYHATGDELAPIAPDRQLIERYCQAGVTVQHVENPGDHFTEVAAGEGGAMRFLADRFAGRPPTNTCGAQARPRSPACTARTRVRVTGVRLTRTMVTVRGTSSTRCDNRARTVTVAIARLTSGRCRFLNRDGRLGRPRPCSLPAGLRATGFARWSLSVRTALPIGRYAVYAWSGPHPRTTRPLRHLRVR